MILPYWRKVNSSYAFRRLRYPWRYVKILHLNLYGITFDIKNNTKHNFTTTISPTR